MPWPQIMRRLPPLFYQIIILNFCSTSHGGMRQSFFLRYSIFESSFEVKVRKRLHFLRLDLQFAKKVGGNYFPSAYLFRNIIHLFFHGHFHHFFMFVAFLRVVLSSTDQILDLIVRIPCFIHNLNRAIKELFPLLLKIVVVWRSIMLNTYFFCLITQNDCILQPADAKKPKKCDV